MISKYKLAVGDRVIHKFRGRGVVCPSEEFNADPTSVMVSLEDDDWETAEVSIGLVSLLKEE
jgi:hypothetical protein